MRTVGMWIVLVGLVIGLGQWQINNIGSAEAQESAQQYAVPGRGFSWSYNPVQPEDRYLGMAFAYLLCGVGGFVYAKSPGEAALKRTRSLAVKAKSVKR